MHLKRLKLHVRVAIFLTGFISGGALIVGCNSDENVGSYNLSPACISPTNEQVSLVYPAPGATMVPDNFGEIILGSSGGGLAPSYRAYVVGASGSANNAVVFGFFGTPIQPPFPTPNVIPAFSNPVYQASESPGTSWIPRSTVSVFLGSSANCTPTLLIGSFMVAGPTPSPSATST